MAEYFTRFDVLVERVGSGVRVYGGSGRWCEEVSCRCTVRGGVARVLQ